MKKQIKITDGEEKKRDKSVKFNMSQIAELVIHLEALYSNDKEFGEAVRNLLSVNHYLEYKKVD